MRRAFGVRVIGTGFGEVNVWVESVRGNRSVGIGRGGREGRLCSEITVRTGACRAGYGGCFMSSAGTFSLPGPLEQTAQGCRPRLEIPALMAMRFRPGGAHQADGNCCMSHGPCLARRPLFDPRGASSHSLACATLLARRDAGRWAGLAGLVWPSARALTGGTHGAPTPTTTTKQHSNDGGCV